MDNNIKTLMIAGVVAAAFLAPALGRSIPQLIQFSAGDPVAASDFNTNFATLRTAVQDLEEKVSALETELGETRSIAGHITLPNGEVVPVRKKLVIGNKTSTMTTLAHGIPGNPGTERRILGCEIIGDGVGVQAVNLAGQTGSQSANWCDVSDTEVKISWGTATAVTYQVVIEYAETPFR